MILDITSGEENDLADGYGFYERQSAGLGDYFRSCLISDIESLAFFAGIHEKELGFFRAMSKRFPFGIYYSIHQYSHHCSCSTRPAARTVMATRSTRKVD